jgi:hypothetical protein
MRRKRRDIKNIEAEVYAELDREFQAGYKHGRTSQLAHGAPYIVAFAQSQSGNWTYKAYALGFEQGRKALRIDVESIIGKSTS